MFTDIRSDQQRATDSKRCPTCGHRPQDEIDRLREQEMGSGGISQTICPACGGNGWAKAGHPLATCETCKGAGTFVRRISTGR